MLRATLSQTRDDSPINATIAVDGIGSGESIGQVNDIRDRSAVIGDPFRDPDGVCQPTYVICHSLSSPSTVTSTTSPAFLPITAFPIGETGVTTER